MEHVADSQFDSPIEAFRAAVTIAGGQVPFAKLVGKTQGAVSKRLKRGKWVWDNKVLLVEAATGISRFALHPLIYPIETPATATGGAPELDMRSSGSGAHASGSSRKGLDTASPGGFALVAPGGAPHSSDMSGPDLDTPPSGSSSTGGGTLSTGTSPADPSIGRLADAPIEGCVSQVQP